MRDRRLAIVATVVISLAAGACSSKKDSAAPPESTSTTASSAASSSSDATSAATSSSSSAASSASSSAPASTEKITLTFWSWVPKISLAVDTWNKSHPNVQVKFEEIPGGGNGGYAKMYAAVKANAAPDTGQIEFGTLPNFIQLGNVEDISKYLDPAVKSTFPDWTWTQVSSGNGIYAIPQDIGPMAFFYRKDLFEAAGITAPPATWEEFAKDAALIQAKSPKSYITSFPTGNADWFTGLVWQTGGRWFDAKSDKWKVAINGGDSKKVGDYWQGLLDKKLVKAEPWWNEDWQKELQNGTLAGWVSGAWGGGNLLGAAPKTSGKWAVAPLPQWEAGANQTGSWGGSTNVVFKGSKHPKEAAEFLQFLNSDPESVAHLGKDSQIFAASSNWQKSDSYSTAFDFFGGQKIYETIAAQKLDPNWQWSPTWTSTTNDWNNAAGSLATGGKIADVLDTTQKKTVEGLLAAGFDAG